VHPGSPLQWNGPEPDDEVASRDDADEFAQTVLPVIRAIQAAGITSFASIADVLNERGGDFFAAERSEWDPETLQEGRYDVAKNMKLFEEANALYRTG
jgi:hypothetical protein